MRGLVKELLTAFMILTALYLLLVNSTGFARDVKAAGTSAAGVWKVAQGR